MVPDNHHRPTHQPARGGAVRFGWRLVGPDGTAVTDGVEIAKLDDAGRFAGTLGFFGPLPA